MRVRLSTIYAACLLVCLAVAALLVVQAALNAENGRRQQAVRRQCVKELALTDLVLFTDARYTRHPSMADRHTPFQDHPTSLEHFPSGTLIAPPGHVRTHAAF